MTVEKAKSVPAKSSPPCEGVEMNGQCGLAAEAVNAVVPAHALDRISNQFQRSARRWEMIIYPAVFALIFMIGAAFFFIYTLTRDMRQLATQMQPEIGNHLSRVAESVTQLNHSLNEMNKNIAQMRVKMEGMSKDMKVVSKQMKNLEEINRQMAQMNSTIGVMTANTEAMRWNMQSMNHSIGKPMSMMNSFMPW